MMLYSLMLLAALPGAGAAGTNAPVHVEKTTTGGAANWRYVDELGRERLWRGINVVYKDPPWLPTATFFNTNFSWVADDAKFLASMVRLPARALPLPPLWAVSGTFSLTGRPLGGGGDIRRASTSSGSV